MMEQTRRDIEAETRRAIEEIRREVADLTIQATEKVTRKSLTPDDQRRLVEDALSELDFTALSAGPAATAPTDCHQAWKRSPRSMRARCSRSPASSDSLDPVKEQLGQFADALNANRDVAIFFFSPYFATEEKKAGLHRLSMAPTRSS